MVLDGDGLCVSSVDNLRCVDCSRCSRVCPILNPVFSNDPEPECYAFRACEEEVLRSSSGGAFFPLAEWMISRGGYVCGVVFDGELNAVYRMTQDIGVVRAMQKSKYVFSEMGDIYGEIEEALGSGKEVLFAG